MQYILEYAITIMLGIIPLPLILTNRIIIIILFTHLAIFESFWRNRNFRFGSTLPTSWEEKWAKKNTISFDKKQLRSLCGVRLHPMPLSIPRRSRLRYYDVCSHDFGFISKLEVIIIDVGGFSGAINTPGKSFW